MKSLNKIISLKVYPFDVMFSFNQTDEVVKKELAKYKIYISVGDSFIEMDKEKTLKGRTVMVTSNQIIIRLNFLPKQNNPIKMSLLQHEIFHAVDFLFSHLETPLCSKTREPYAYLIQYLTKNIYKYLT